MDKAAKVVGVLLAVLVLVLALISYDIGSQSANKYRECRALASIETCVAHVGLEKPATASQR